jgi:putative transposase
MQVMSNGRVRRSESEWRELIARWGKSGVSAREFCQKQDVQVSSFHRWQQRLRETKRNDPATTPDFIPVTGGSLSITAASSWSLEIALPNGATVRFQG